jgi:hypothetical protein
MTCLPSSQGVPAVVMKNLQGENSTLLVTVQTQHTFCTLRICWLCANPTASAEVRTTCNLQQQSGPAGTNQLPSSHGVSAVVMKNLRRVIQQGNAKQTEYKIL